MQRHKLLALVTGALAALGGASLAVLGNAQATSWHDYSGDLFPGHAYGLQVPPGAKAYEILLEGEPDGTAPASATLALFDPEGEALGHRVLDAANPSILVGDPAQGRHVVYVYDLQAGALKLRVDAPLAPLTADLQKMPLHKSDLTLLTSGAAAPLDLEEERDLGATPVFLTLLYEGSVEGLDATIASAKGDVVTIRGESGTAFAPGVWSSLSGERASDAANLEGSLFTVKAAAARFEGTLVLTTVAIDHEAPVPVVPEEPEKTPASPAPAPDPVPVPVNGAFTARVGKAMAFTATAGAIRVAQLEPVVEGHEDERYWTGALAVYRPDDSLLAYVDLDTYEPNATIRLPEAGEYVVFVHDAPHDGFLVQLVGDATMSGLRELALGTEEFDFTVSSGLRFGDEDGEAFTLRHAPVAMKAVLDGNADALLSSVFVENENGVAVEARTFAQLAMVQYRDASYQQPENFAAGEHVVRATGITEGTLRVVSTYFLRQDAPAEHDHEEHEAHPDEAGLLGFLRL